MTTNEIFTNKELFVNQLRDGDIVKMEDGFYYSIKKLNSGWQLQPVKNGHEYANQILFGAIIVNHLDKPLAVKGENYFPIGTFDYKLVGVDLGTTITVPVSGGASDVINVKDIISVSYSWYNDCMDMCEIFALAKGGFGVAYYELVGEQARKAYEDIARIRG